MTPRWRIQAAASGLALVAAMAQAADAPLAVRSGNHTTFGRIVFDTTSAARYTLSRDGDRVAIRFTTGQTLGPPPPPPRNVQEIRTTGADAELTLTHGATIHPTRIGGRVVLDIFPPAPEESAEHAPVVEARAARRQAGTVQGADARPPGTRDRQPATPAAPGTEPSAGAASAPEAAAPGSGTAAAFPAQAAADLHETTPVQRAERSPVASEPLRTTDAVPLAPEEKSLPGRDLLPQRYAPSPLAARRVRLPPDIGGAAFLAPFGSDTGAAAFRGRSAWYVVFDQKRAVDLAPLKDDPLFGAVTVDVLPAATVFRVPLPEDQTLSLALSPQGWRIDAMPSAGRQQAIIPVPGGGRLSLPAEAPSRIVSIPDPDTGAMLLVGTQRRPGQETAMARQTPEFILRPTVQGVMIEPLADYLSLKNDAQGFTLSSYAGPLMLSPETQGAKAVLEAGTLKRRFDLPDMPLEGLVRLADRQFREIAALQPLSRGAKRRALAETLLAMGLPAEAYGLLRFTAEQDPQEAQVPDTVALTAIAALLSGRVNEADGLDDPRLNGTDDIALWRAVRLAMTDEGSPAAAAVFAQAAPLILTYPQPIADRLLPLVTETMLLGGEIAPAADLLDQRPNDPRLAYARALRRQAEGDPDQALTMLDELANGRDQFDRTRAAVHAIELRLKLRRTSPAQAAEALDKLLYAWRGDERELAVRERIAALRAQTGAWRSALTMLRDAEADFPEHGKQIHEKLRETFAAMIRDDASRPMPPLEFVATVDENLDLLNAARNDVEVEQRLAERLVALDLPSRAEPLLRKLMETAPGSAQKAQYGASLATLLAREWKDAEAIAALDASETSDLPVELAETRILIRAGAIARMGDRAGALSLLSKLGTAAADAARAELHEQAGDWQAAERAWADCAGQSIQDQSALTEDQTRVVVRLATAAARAGDEAGLTALRARYESRLARGSLADMFRLLTAEPIRTSKDIERSKQELNIAASLPASLKALQGSTAAR